VLIFAVAENVATFAELLSVSTAPKHPSDAWLADLNAMHETVTGEVVVNEARDCSNAL